MRNSLWSLFLLAAVGITGCGTASIHPLASDDTRTFDAALVGQWAKSDKDDTVYTVAASGDQYTLVIEDKDAQKPERFEFEMRLVQLGKHRFVDVQAPQSERKKLDDKWSSLFIPAHLFGRYTIDADTLKFWILNDDWLRNSLRDGKVTLAHTRIDHDRTLITASTVELQAFLKAHAEDAGAFDLTELKRIKP